MQGILFKPWKQTAIRGSPLDKLWQTRRLDHLKEINKAPNLWKWIGYDQEGRFSFRFEPSGDVYNYFPRYRAGETVYIKEAYSFIDYQLKGEWEGYIKVLYALDKVERWIKRPQNTNVIVISKHSPMFMPAWAARDYIKITDVRPERLRDITLEDAYDEGIDTVPAYDRIDAFKRLWDSINPKYPYSLNPYVWRICFNLMEDKR